METKEDVIEMLNDAIRCINKGNPVAAREYTMTACQMINNGALRR